MPIPPAPIALSIRYWPSCMPGPTAAGWIRFIVQGGAIEETRSIRLRQHGLDFAADLGIRTGQQRCALRALEFDRGQIEILDLAEPLRRHHLIIARTIAA